MTAVFEYFVATPDELSRLDVAKSPLAQLGDTRAIALPLVDPSVVLLALVEVLSAEEYDDLLDRSENPIVAEAAPDDGVEGPWVTRIDDFVVDTIRGADGDPELEWDDAVSQWGKRIADELTVDFADDELAGGPDPDEDELLDATDELRRICGQTDAQRHLYCWTQP